MRIYSNAYDCAITINYYGDKYLSVFLHTLINCTIKIYNHILLKISINNNTLLYIRTNTHNNYYKKALYLKKNLKKITISSVKKKFFCIV